MMHFEVDFFVHLLNGLARHSLFKLRALNVGSGTFVNLDDYLGEPQPRNGENGHLDQNQTIEIS